MDIDTFFMRVADFVVENFAVLVFFAGAAFLFMVIEYPKIVETVFMFFITSGE